MADLGVMDIFKCLPAAKKKAAANCKKCGCSGCMMFAVKLSKGEADISLCSHVPADLKEKFSHSKKLQQQAVEIIGSLKTLTVGGEKVMYRHEKTFLTKPPLLVLLDPNSADFEAVVQKIAAFKIDSIGEELTVEGVLLTDENEKARKTLLSYGLNFIEKAELQKLQEVQDDTLPKTLDTLQFIRGKAILDRDENYAKPVFVHLKTSEIQTLCAKASAYICKYASLLVFDTFDEALFTILYMLRQNIFTDPQMPLQVESKVYEFNNPGEDAYVFLTTNFALSYFAVANEISNLKKGSYLIITPSEGMSVLTAWSAQKITAEIASRVVSASSVLNKVKNKRIIIPGLLKDLKDELQNALPDWEIIPGTVEACKISEFIKKLDEP